MSSFTKGAALTACGGLLIAGLTALPAQAAGDTVKLKLRYAGGPTRTVEVKGADTVAEAITKLKLKVDGNDRVTPSRNTRLTNGMKLTIDVVSGKTLIKKVTLKYKTINKKTKSLYKGDRQRARTGHNGKANRAYRLTIVNGKVTAKKMVRQRIITKVVNKVVLIGTNTKHRINLARLAKWNKIAKCESSGNWHLNTGNGYYGGLQFNLETWRSVKGQHFARYPHKATKREQITVANRLYAKRGFQPWTCRHVL